MDINLMRLAWTVLDEGLGFGEKSPSLRDRIDAVVKEMERRMILSPQDRQQVLAYLCDRQHLIQTLIYR